MSFILDALKKAEGARPAPAMPQLPTVEVATAGPPRRRQSPAWLVAGLLAVLLAAALAWTAWREFGAAPAAVPPAPGAISPVPPTTGPPPVADAPPAVAAAPDPDGRRAEVRPLDSEARAGQPPPAPVSSSAAPRNVAPADPLLAAGVAPQRRVTPGTVVYEDGPLDLSVPAAPTGGGSVQYQRNLGNEPAPENPAEAAAPPPDGDVAPLYSNLKLRGGLPDLHLDIHVYSQAVSKRFVFVNSRKYRQGETTREGVVVEAITPTGATLSYRGQRFTLARN